MRILLLDDDRSRSDALRMETTYDVTPVCDTLDASGYVERHHYDAILVDMKVPGRGELFRQQQLPEHAYRYAGVYWCEHWLFVHYSDMRRRTILYTQYDQLPERVARALSDVPVLSHTDIMRVSAVLKKELARLPRIA